MEVKYFFSVRNYSEDLKNRRFEELKNLKEVLLNSFFNSSTLQPIESSIQHSNAE